MARQVLENGVILPAEYSDDWYDDMTSNLTKLDDVIGSDSEKLSSADVGAAALSNNYNDLDNLPTIPTVNDATLTIQKNGVDVQTFTANASSNVTCNITVPTKTSDLTNDSNFVDTSNSAVASGITSAKVTSYDAHIADTDIHVTTADKNRWNNNTYVFRYSSTALVASSTNSNTLLDNTDNLKVGDKVIDSSGVLFSITAIDTANSTFTVGSALIDLALDGNVVHTSGSETISGRKTYTNNIIPLKSLTSEYGVLGGSTTIIFSDKNSVELSKIALGNYTSGIAYNKFTICAYDSNNQLVERTLTYSSSNGSLATAFFRPDNDNIVSLGTVGNKWSKVYATNYYYGSNNVEFSTKFVTTDTNQTISGNKTFSSNVNVYNSDSSTDIANLTLKNQKAVKSGSLADSQIIYFTDSSTRSLATIRTQVGINGQSILGLRADNTDSNNNAVYSGFSINSYKDGTKNILPNTNGDIDFGTANAKWKSFNGLEPSSLSLPSGNASDVIDISSYITALDGTSNSYTVPANGWISIAVVGTAIDIVSSSWSDSRLRASSGNVRMLYPVLKNETLDISVMGTTLSYARFIPCQGNV